MATFNFFIKRQAIWIGIGTCRVHFCGAHEPINSGKRTCGFVSRWRWPLWRFVTSAHRNAHQRIASLVGYRPDHISAVELQKIATIIFLAAWFARREKPDGNCFRNLLFACNYQRAAALVLGKSYLELQP